MKKNRNLSEEHRSKISKSMLGVKKSELHKNHIRESMIGKKRGKYKIKFKHFSYGNNKNNQTL